MKYKVHTLETPLSNDHLALHNLVLESDVLKGNALKDSAVRHNYVLAPKDKKTAPLVVHLSGYFGNGTQSLNMKTLDENFPQAIIEATRTGKIAPAVHVFVDAMTSVGGSQFINSDACGNYEDYIQSELLTAIEKEFFISKDSTQKCVMGTSSGGYGALHHVSLAKSPFGVAVAIAPDADFAVSLMPDLYKAAPYLEEFKTLTDVKKKFADKEWLQKKSSFNVMNAVAMALCYSPVKKGRFEFPINLKTAELNEDIWNVWREKDPIRFVRVRAEVLKKRMIYLEVGEFDEFCLYFGARYLKEICDKNKIPNHYGEFKGGHFNLQDRKIKALEWLKKQWK